MDVHTMSKLMDEMKKTVIDNMNIKRDISDDEVEDLITTSVFTNRELASLGIIEKQQIIKKLFNSIRKLDVLQPLIEDKSITEIMVNGYDKIFVERFGRVEKLNTAFESQKKLEDVIQAIVSKVNRTVNESSPIVDARLEDGSRVSAVLPPVALNGPILTIRRFPDKPILMEDLIKYGSINAEASTMLQSMVKAKFNIFICGGTGSGKTTFLNALSNFIPDKERIITIEDSAELQIQGIQNIVRLETRNTNTEGKGEITIKDLIKCSLRMRPERIVVGEVRGAEALDMLQAMNTGHDGSLSTGHANSPKDMLNRLETMVLSGGVMPLESIRQQIASAIDIIVQLSRIRDASRKVLEITEVAGYDRGSIILNPLYIFRETGESEDGKVVGSLERTENAIQNSDKFKMAGIRLEL